MSAAEVDAIGCRAIVRCETSPEAHVRSKTCVAPTVVGGAERGSYMLANPTIFAEALCGTAAGCSYGVRD